MATYRASETIFFDKSKLNASVWQYRHKHTPSGLGTYISSDTPGFIKMVFHLPAGDTQLYEVREEGVREAHAEDFRKGDIITDSLLTIMDYEITGIHLDPKTRIASEPIEASQIDDQGVHTGDIFYFEPSECILKKRCKPDCNNECKGPEPKNNDGRETCYWCGAQTKNVPGISMGSYDICTNKECGK